MLDHTYEQLSTPLDDNYTRGTCTFGRQRQCLIQLCMKGTYDWLKLTNPGMDTTIEIETIPLRFFTDDPENPKKSGFFRRNSVDLPRSAMAKYFPAPIGGRINWRGLSEFKLTWKVSKAAIIYRAHQLSLLSDTQYKTAFLGLKRKGEAIEEKEDYLIPHEKPELFHRAIKVLINDVCIDIEALAKRLKITVPMLLELANDNSLYELNNQTNSANVISMFSFRSRIA
ncbi:ImmA/IrrE family metallo-endopeptidase [Photorhabdus hainanensis]|uniref:ImmA/IrrE family metallo-endopeptidase n=1 Tax=Photorhabdus hainanensis TaxID=1004166 RepID=UPI001FE9C17B|nr:hypothetical protein [Photorhabdus hainanensis]